MSNSPESVGKFQANEMEPRTAAVISGVGLLLMAVIAAPANFGAIQSVIVPGDAAATASNILTTETTFRLGAVGLIIVALLDILVAWGLYITFRRELPGLALLGGWLRLAYAALFALAINELFSAARLAGSDPGGSLLQLHRFNDGWMIGQVVFGCHLAMLGVTAWRSAVVHKLFGVLLLIAGFGYLFDGVSHLLDPEFGVELALFTFPGEVVFIFWLLIRGRRL